MSWGSAIFKISSRRTPVAEAQNHDCGDAHNILTQRVLNAIGNSYHKSLNFGRTKDGSSNKAACPCPFLRSNFYAEFMSEVSSLIGALERI
jgi:hypothetical protein